MLKGVPLNLIKVNANVYSMHLPDGSHVGNLKRIGAIWKFKALGYDAAGKVIPGGGPLTDRHNTAFSAPDAAEVSARLYLGNGVKMVYPPSTLNTAMPYTSSKQREAAVRVDHC